MSLLFKGRGPRGPRGLKGDRGDRGDRGEPAPDQGVTTRIFTGTMLDPGDEVTHILWEQPSHRASMIDLKVMAHDLNSNTHSLFYHAESYWSRSWTNAPVKTDLITPVVAGNSTFAVTHDQQDNSIYARLRFTGTIQTNIRYKIIAQIMVV